MLLDDVSFGFGYIWGGRQGIGNQTFFMAFGTCLQTQGEPVRGSGLTYDITFVIPRLNSLCRV